MLLTRKSPFDKSSSINSDYQIRSVMLATNGDGMTWLTSRFIAVMPKWPWRYRSRSKDFTHDTSSWWLSFVQNTKTPSLQCVVKHMSRCAICNAVLSWPWRYRSTSSHYTPPQASDHLCQTWLAFVQNCSHYRTDAARCAIFSQIRSKVMADRW